MPRVSCLFVLCGCLCIGSGCDQRTNQPPGGGGSTGRGGGAGGFPGGGGASVASSGDSGGTASGGSRSEGGGGSGGGGGVETGGKPGVGGATRNGGGSGTAGATGMGGKGGGTASGGDCIVQAAKISSGMATVGIVTWSSTVPDLKSAKIDFGPTVAYGLTAPVDAPTAGDNITLLLGMKQSKTYHYRITATGSDGDCVGPDATLQTGALMTGLPRITQDTRSKAALYGGFLLTGQYVNIGASGPPAYIVDADGDMVWAYKFPTNVTGAVMSYDGKYMWINSANVGDPKGVTVHRVSMDGIGEDKSSAFAGLNHQLTVLPDETVAFYAYNSARKCEDIKEYSPATGKVRVVVNAADAQGGATECHLNYITYAKDDDTYLYSDLDNQVVVKVRRSDGTTVWIANGPHPTVTGDSWKGVQHGIHVLEADKTQGFDRFLLYNNNSRVTPGGTGTAGGDGTGAYIFELKVEYLSAKKITKLWTYETKVPSDVMGDVQRLDNGNTIIAHSLAGVVQEIDKNSNLVQEWSFPAGSSIGYIQKRKTLYGPPPK